jgi:hypothetical protein
MSRVDILKEIYCKKKLIRNFDFDGLIHPPISCYLTETDIGRLNYIATSAKYGSKSKAEKFAMVDQIMNPRGFKRMASGTNRIAYRYEYDQSFILKVAIDSAGINDSPDELANQNFIKPFVTKIFDATPCGTVGMAERVNPIKSQYQFENIAEEVFDILQNFFIGKYVLEDIGSTFFKNWGVRDGFGPVLLDFPYLYEIDGDKLQCSVIFPNGKHCSGLIDYDDGLNQLKCEECGQRYSARSLSKNNNVRKPIKSKFTEGDSIMEEIKVSVSKGGKDYKLYNESDFIAPNHQKKFRKPKEEEFKVTVTGGFNRGEKQTVLKPEDEEYIRKNFIESGEGRKAFVVAGQQQTGTYIKIKEGTILPDNNGNSFVTQSQIINSPDIDDEDKFEEVPKPHFEPRNENSTLVEQDEKTEEQFVTETKKEQEELEHNEEESKHKKVTARERATMNSYMVGQMKHFPFENYTKSTTKQRSDIIDYLTAALNSKFSLEPEIAVMTAVNFVDAQYRFNDTEEASKELSADAKAEKLAKEYFGRDYEKVQEVEQPIKKRNVIKEF